MDPETGCGTRILRRKPHTVARRSIELLSGTLLGGTQAHLDDVEVGVSVLPEVRVVDAVVLDPLHVRLSVRHDAALERRVFAARDGRVARRMRDERRRHRASRHDVEEEGPAQLPVLVGDDARVVALVVVHHRVQFQGPPVFRNLENRREKLSLGTIVRFVLG